MFCSHLNRHRSDNRSRRKISVDEFKSPIVPNPGIQMPSSSQQSDFSALAVFHSQHSVAAVTRGITSAIDCSPRSDKLESSYAPINFISPEICAMIEKFENGELAKARQIQNRDQFLESGRVISSDSTSEESGRALPPPKRYFRTSWRHITRILLKHHKL